MHKSRTSRVVHRISQRLREYVVLSLRFLHYVHLHRSDSTQGCTTSPSRNG